MGSLFQITSNWPIRCVRSYGKPPRQGRVLHVSMAEVSICSGLTGCDVIEIRTVSDPTLITFSNLFISADLAVELGINGRKRQIIKKKLINFE